MKKDDKPIESSDLTEYMIAILDSFNFKTKVNFLVNAYLEREKIRKPNDIKSAKSTIYTNLANPDMSWGKFKHILLSVLNPISVTITIDVKLTDKITRTSKFTIDNRKDGNGQSK